MAVSVTVALEMEFSGAGSGWTDVIADLCSLPVPHASYGIRGSSPLDRAPDIGTFEFALNNSESNSGGKDGYYSPGHADCRSGFDVGINVRLKITHLGTTRYKFVGQLEEAEPLPGSKGKRKTLCVVEDWIGIAARTPIERVATQTDQRLDQLVTTLLANVTRQPTDTDFDTCLSTFPYLLDTTRDERTRLLRELFKGAMSELGWITPRGNTTTGGVLAVDSRHSRIRASNTATLSNSMSGLDVKRSRSNIYNRVKMTVHPREVDAAATTVLYSAVNEIVLAPGETKILVGQYRDPDERAIRVGGTAMVTPVATTDYLMNDTSGGGGADITSDLTVTANYGSNGVKWTLENTGSTTGYITKLQCRGKGVYDYQPITVEEEDATSIAAHGDRVLEIDMYYEDDDGVATDAAKHYILSYKDPMSVVERLKIDGNMSDTLMTAALTLEPGSKVTLAEDQTGLSQACFVNGVDIYLKPANIEFEFGMAAAEYSQYWILGDATLSILDSTTRAGF